MKKILFVIGSLGGGGAEKVLVDTVNSLNPDEYQITICSIFNEGVHRDELNSYVNYKSIVKVKNTMVRKVVSLCVLYILPAKFLYTKIKRMNENYDFEVAFLEGLPTKIVSKSTSNSIKYAWVHINFDNNFDSLRYFHNIKEYAKCYRKYNKIFCVSEVARKGFINKFGNNYPTEVLYNPLDEKSILNKSYEEFDGYPQNGNIVMVTVGRLVEQKGYDRLLKAVSALSNKSYHFYLYILGEGNEKSKLQNFIKRNCLEDIVRLVGYKKNPYPYIKNANVFICSSREEGFSTVVTESLILGTPVITTNCSGMKELFGDYECGKIVENSTEGIIEGLKTILDNEELIVYYKQQAIKRGQYFKMEERIMELKKIFK